MLSFLQENPGKIPAKTVILAGTGTKTSNPDLALPVTNSSWTRHNPIKNSSLTRQNLVTKPSQTRQKAAKFKIQKSDQ